MLPAQPWDGFEHEGGHATGGAFGDEGIVEFQVLFGIERTVAAGPPGAIGVGARHHVEAGAAGRAAELVHPRQADGVARLAVKVGETTDELVLAGGRAAGPQGGFDGRGARVVELDSAKIAGHNRGHFFQQADFHLGSEVVGVHQGLGRLGHRFGDLGMAVAQIGDVDPTGEVDVLVAVGVDHFATVAAFEGHREELHLAGEAADILAGTRVQGVALGTGQGVALDTWIFVEIDCVLCWIVGAH